jgi:hypothetical protein
MELVAETDLAMTKLANAFANKVMKGQLVMVRLTSIG